VQRYLIGNPRHAVTLAKYSGLTPDDFHLPRLRYVKATPYTDEIVADTYHWMARWGLISSAACTANLVDNRLTDVAAAPVGD
jgi:NitT/TauT family transport system substrate-binding protein